MDTRMSASPGAERAGGVVHVIDGAIRQADVVEDVVELVGRNRPPYGVLDEVPPAGRFLNAGAGFGADVEEYLAAVRVREEVLPSQGTRRKTARQLRRNTGMKRARRWTSVVSSRW